VKPETEEKLAALAVGLRSFMDQRLSTVNVEDLELRVDLTARQIGHLAREYPEELARALGVRKVRYYGSSYTRSQDPRAARQHHYGTARYEKPSISIFE